MEHLHNGFTLDTPSDTFALSTDSVLLSDYVRLSAEDRVLDLGSGCGTLGILLCAKNSRCHVTGIELDPIAHNAALDNIARNQLQAHMNSICADLRSVSSVLGAGSFDICVSNPPYFTGGPSSRTPLARRNDTCSTQELFQAAAWALRFGGDFYLVQRPENLAQLCHAAISCGLEPKHLRTVRHRRSSPISLILLHCKKGAKPGLSWDSLCLFTEQEVPTEEYKRIYHL